jgi:hypothetical protein
MEDITITKEQLIEMFSFGELKDDNKGWLFHDTPIDIIAIHEIDPKYISDITNAQYYKLVEKQK